MISDNNDFVYVVIYEYGDDPTERKPYQENHREYLADLESDGVLIAAGPVCNENSGILILKGSDEAKMRRKLSQDPYSLNHVIRNIRVMTWNYRVGTVVQQISKANAKE